LSSVYNLGNKLKTRGPEVAHLNVLAKKKLNKLLKSCIFKYYKYVWIWCSDSWEGLL